MGDITECLSRWAGGDASAYDELVELVYDEMRRIARGHLAQERATHTLSSTALVHEVYLRLAGQGGIPWSGRAHFFGAVANIMRRILVDHARQRLAGKRGEGAVHEDLEQAMLTIAYEPDLDVVALDEALTKLAEFDPRRARIVEMRYFAGLTIEETAALLEVTPSAVNRDWAVARAWLFRSLASTPTESAAPGQ